uniref:Uncharacterized protein n=1 Tax=Anguilla anguilla TaxID=7936 RepID=A0A0E9WCK2_ANGAN
MKANTDTLFFVGKVLFFTNRTQSVCHGTLVCCVKNPFKKVQINFVKNLNDRIPFTKAKINVIKMHIA